jgi:DNA-binding NtrC family response regulator
MTKKAILCVDDEVIILVSLIRELKSHFKNRYIYEQATNAQSALRIIDELAEENIEVIIIISDWLMPGMKGDEFLEETHAKHPDIHSIMITGQADLAAIDRIKKNESVLAVFNKPWDPELLIKTIEESIQE